MTETIFSKCGMRCDLCLLYRPNVEKNDRREEVCRAFSKVWPGFSPDPKTTICDGCGTDREGAVRFSPDCQTRRCVTEKGIAHCGFCGSYPCPIFPAEPSHEELVRKIDVEKQWTWEEEALMEAYTCRKNMDAFRRNRTRKETAEYFLRDCGLLEELGKYGKVHPIGSYRMDMMAWNDLDLDVENEDMSLEKLHQLTSFIIRRFRPVWYEAKEETGPDGKRVWFHGFETRITGELWNIDIWFFGREKIEEAVRYCDGIAQKASEKQKQIIVAIKEALIARGLYAFDKYRSIDVYKAVTEMDVGSVEEFLTRYPMEKN